VKKSDLEEKFSFYWRLLHPELPEPEVHYRKAIPGRRLELDFAWPDHGKIGVEVQGGTWAKGRKQGHTRGSMYERDCIKLNLMQREGWDVYWLTTTMLTNDPDRWLGLIAEAVTKGGE